MSVCPKCNKESLQPGWCKHCHHYHIALTPEQPIYLNAIVDELMWAVQKQLGDNNDFEIKIGPNISDGNMWWAASVSIRGSEWMTTRRPQTNPSDALRELAEIIDAAIG